MPSSAAFWKYFNEEAAPQQQLRGNEFRQMFTYLDRVERPVGIVETGCVRSATDWGEGRSTVLFAKYAECHPGSVVYSVDINPETVAMCRALVGDWVRLHCGDSVAFLKTLADRPPADLGTIDLLYLDSYDVDFENPLLSAIHHLKELAAVGSLLSAETLVAIDDSPLACLAVQGATGQLNGLGQPRISGKGKLIAEYAAQVGGQQLLSGYQVAWIGLGRPQH
jgi:hypothetical protein